MSAIAFSCWLWVTPIYPAPVMCCSAVRAGWTSTQADFCESPR